MSSDSLYGLNPPVYIDMEGLRVVQRKEIIHPNAKLATHAKESPIQTRGKAFYLVSSRPINPADVT